MVGEFTMIDNAAATVTVEVAVLEQPLVVPVTVQVVVIAGLAVAVLTPVDVAPALHVQDEAPLAVNAAVCAAQMVGEFTVTVGNAVTFTVETAVFEHKPTVPVTVQVVVIAGVASAVFTPVEVAPALHVQDVAPFAVKLAVCPAQIVGEFTVTFGNDVTVTVDTAVFEQAPDVPVTVQDVVNNGLASAVLTPVDVAPADHV